MDHLAEVCSGTARTGVIRALECFGRAASLEELRAVAGPSTDAVRDALAALEADGTVVVRGTPATYGLVPSRAANGAFNPATMRSEEQLAMTETERAAIHSAIFTMLRLRKLRGEAVSAHELAHHAMCASARPLAIRELLADAAHEATEHDRHADAARWFARLAAEAADERTHILALADCAHATAKFDAAAAEELSARALNLIEAIAADAGASPADRARMLEASARLLVAKHRSRSIERAKEAARIYESIGAEPQRAALAAWIERVARPRGRPKAPGVLTDREREVADLVGEGFTDRQIAARLFLSEATVRKHVENAKRKLNVSKRIELLTRLQRI